MSTKADFDTEKAIAEIAESGNETENEVRAHAWKGLAHALAEGSLAEGVELEDAFEGAVAHIHSELTGSENVVAAARQRELHGTGVDDRHRLSADKEPSATAKEIMGREPSDDIDDYRPGVQ